MGDEKCPEHDRVMYACVRCVNKARAEGFAAGIEEAAEAVSRAKSVNEAFLAVRALLPGPPPGGLCTCTSANCSKAHAPAAERCVHGVRRHRDIYGVEACAACVWGADTGTGARPRCGHCGGEMEPGMWDGAFPRFCSDACWEKAGRPCPAAVPRGGP